MKKQHYIGIDCGVNTGLASWSVERKEFFVIETLMIHQALEKVKNWNEHYSIFVCVEDARQRKWFGKTNREVLQGAGSIKRDAKIWEDFLKDSGIEFQMVAPKNNKTKLTAEKFNQLTKWTGRTNEHARDAAMLVFG